MSVVRLAGERYLWVDSLCIPQDQSDWKHDAIASLHVIFVLAVFTIIAMTGEKAESGLFREGEEAFQLSAQTAPGFTLASFTIYRNASEISRDWTHMARAWT